MITRKQATQSHLQRSWQMHRQDAESSRIHSVTVMSLVTTLLHKALTHLVHVLGSRYSAECC